MKSIVTIVILVIATLLLLNHPSDKKESSAELSRTVIGIGLIVAGALLLPSLVGTAPGIVVVLIGIGVLLGGGGLVGLLTPDLNISPVVIIIAALFIFVIAIKRKR